VFAKLGTMFVLLVLCWAAPGPSARADGLVISATPPGEAGPQVDAAQVSPAQRTAPPAASTPRTYVVQRGDTLSAIAARFGTSVAALMSQNGLASADRVSAGQVLQISSSVAPLPKLPEAGALARVQFWPWPPVQGQTLAVWLHTRAAVSLTLRFGASTIPVVTEGRHGWALAPIEALAAPETRALTVTAGSLALAFPVPIRAGVFEVQEIAAEASDPILSQVAKVNAEYARVTELFAGRSASGWTPRGRFITPLAAGVAYEFSSPFGSRRTYGSAAGLTAHAGEDYAVPSGTPVLAPAAGLVVLAEPLFVRGNAVVLDHGHGVFTGYWHLETLGVKAGERVAVGQALGAVGSTGLSTGPHLHWELRVAGVAVDPLQWVEKK
jgi:murein DD-endopeptidase MepM/ murein hydrolase activator NlpD